MTTTLNASTAGAGGFIATGDNSGSLALQTAGTTAVTITTAQNVGIGTASPNATNSSRALTVNGATDAAYELMSNGTMSAYLYSDGATLTASNVANGSFVFKANNTEIFRIMPAGNFVVGATGAPGGNAFGSIQNVCSASSNSLYTKNTNSAPYGIEVQYSGAAPNGTGNPFLECFDTGATRVVFRSNGGLANYSANNANLSDQREKKDIALAPNYLGKICQIPVKTFLFNDQTDSDLNLGVIAQDVQAVCPELVMESNWAGKNEPEKMRLSIYQTDLQYALMKSIQELKAINDTQAETINALTARVVALESK